MVYEKKRVIEQFGKNAAHYVTSQMHANGPDLQKMIDLVSSENPSGELLDIATGAGHVANALAPFFKQVVALDLTPEMLEKAKGMMASNGINNVSFVQGDAENLPFPNESVGTVTCRIAPHHFSNIRVFVQEVYRVLKANGLFLLVDNIASEKDRLDLFYNRIEKKRDPSHVRAYKKSDWLGVLEKEGFMVEEMFSFDKKFVFEKWCSMMDLPDHEKQELNQLMISSSKEIQDFFAMVVEDGKVQSFQGQSVLFVVRK